MCMQLRYDYSSIAILPVNIAPNMATKSSQRPTSAFKSDDLDTGAGEGVLEACLALLEVSGC